MISHLFATIQTSVKEAARVKYNTLDIDYLLEVDRRVLDLQHEVEDARAEQNKISKRVQQAGKDKASTRRVDR